MVPRGVEAVRRGFVGRQPSSEPTSLLFPQAPPAARAGGLTLTAPVASVTPQPPSQQADAQPPPTTALPWPDAFAPTLPSDLVVHRAKVDAVVTWLRDAQTGTGPRLLVAVGPLGCGKAATVRAVAAAHHARVVEWEAPAAATWDEARYIEGGSGGVGAYESRLAAFQGFVAGAALGGLPLSEEGGAPASSSSSSRVLLVRDLPHASDRAARTALAACLASLASTSGAPVALCVTAASGRDARAARDARGADAAAGPGGGLHRDLEAAARGAGAVFVAFNKITDRLVGKAVLAAAARARAPLGAARAAAIAAAAGGDVRSALLAAQLATAGEERAAAVAAVPTRKRRGGAGAVAPTPAPDPAAAAAAASLAGRDAGMDVLHALGRILHNKRDWAGEEEEDGATQAEAPPTPDRPAATTAAAIMAAALREAAPDFSDLHPSLVRPTPTVDAEGAADAAGLDARGASAWLFDNLPTFVSGEAALTDAALAAQYISAADAGAQPRAGPMADAAARCVAVRGVLFARARPAPRGWLSIKGPLCFTVARGVSSNAARLRGLAPLTGARDAATTLLPALRALAALDPSSYAGCLPPVWARVVGEDVRDEWPRPAGVVGRVVGVQSDGDNAGADDDPIEEDD